MEGLGKTPIMAFMFVCANDFGVDRDMVCHQSVGDNPFFKPEVFGRMACINRVDLSFELLSIATGMKGFTNIVICKDG